MDSDAFDNAECGLRMLEIAAMAYETGRQDVLDALHGCAYSYDDEYEFAMSGMDKLCDFMEEHSREDSEICTMYFSSNAMMEYYRLCREYGKLKGVSLKKNPYMLRASQEMREKMYEDGCYYCDYWLQTKINHKWASGIVFKYDISYFSEFLALFSRLLYVFEFYTEAVKELCAEVERLKQPKGQILMLPAPKEFERRAA